jgi:hypothetical protein
MVGRHFHLDPNGLARASCSIFGAERSAKETRFAQLTGIAKARDNFRQFLATRSHQTSLAHQHSGLCIPQTRPIEVGPYLLAAIVDNRSNLEPIRLGQGRRLARLDLGSEARQGNDGCSQQRKYRQSNEGFKHFGVADFG